MSLTIEKKTENEAITVVLSGKLDTITAPELEASLDQSLESAKELTIDCGGLQYISSAGLRVILKAQKAMNKKGSMKLINVSDNIMEIFDITGFVDFLTIE